MDKPICVGPARAKTIRLIIAAILLVLAGRTFNANAQTETNLHPFVGSPSEGAYPYAGLIQGSDGNLYGTTAFGGAKSGTVFRISLSGTLSNLYSFAYPNPYDGRYPVAGLVQGSDSNFYGTTEQGGPDFLHFGSVFRIIPGSSYSQLYAFGTNLPYDGHYPAAGLVQGSDGNFYGTTELGGTHNTGTVFRISPSGSETNLYSFAGSPGDGALPLAGLVQGSDSNFYGTTYFGGTKNLGTVFRISLSGTYTSLYSFVGSPDGANPYGGLVQGSDGNFYGTTEGGGTNNYGTIFRIKPSGTYTSLYTFGGSPTDGGYPLAGLVQGSDGNFYGTTYNGGTSTNCGVGIGCGTVFRISPSGSYTKLYSFVGPLTDGAGPAAGLVQGSDGNFYGTTLQGGSNSTALLGTLGTVFKFSVPLNPPPNQISGIHIAATNIIFTIPSVAYETYQLQFSSSMNPTNWVNVSGVSVTNSIGALLTLTNFGGAVGPLGFYRFDITP
jgi:uncharacterized repeat protein (TIGR03803 family)